VKKLISILALAAAVMVASCTPDQIAANEAKMKAVVAQINAGVKTAAADIQSGIQAACDNDLAIAVAANTTRSIFIQQVGPNTTQNINNLDSAVAAYNSACSAFNSGTTPSAQLVKTAVSAYNSIKAAKAAAGVM
jgi:hypothetical protein